MAVHFDRSRMAEVVERHELWWNHKLGRPLAFIEIYNAHERPECGCPLLSQANCHDLGIDPEEVIRTYDNYLGGMEWMGDGFPHMDLDRFGPGIVAAFCEGAVLDNSSGRVWFFPAEKKHISEIHAVYHPDNVWVKRIKQIIKTGVEFWDGKVLIGMPDLGGIMDIAASFVGTEDLLIYLLEEPDEVKRLLSEIQTAWYSAFDDMAGVLAPQGGFTDWSLAASKKPSYITQCDFSAMIGQDMFREFALESLRADTQRLWNCMYHLDGPQAVRHLDALLTLNKLKSIQWIYGAGSPRPMNWLDLYRKIDAAGKLNVILGTPKEYLDVLSEIHGTPFSIHKFDRANIDIARKIIDAR